MFVHLHPPVFVFVLTQTVSWHHAYICSVIYSNTSLVQCLLLLGLLLAPKGDKTPQFHDCLILCLGWVSEDGKSSAIVSAGARSVLMSIGG